MSDVDLSVEGLTAFFRDSNHLFSDRGDESEIDPSRTEESPFHEVVATPSRDPVPPRPKVDPVPVPTPYRGDGVGHPVPDPVPGFGTESFSEGSSWVPIDIVAVASEPPAPPAIVDLFYPGYNHLVSGESEALKTWLLLAAVARELGERRGVPWVDGDDVGEGALLERLRLLGASDEAIAALFAYMRPSDPIGEHIGVVLDVVERRNCRLAVFDGFNPLLALHGLDPNVGADVERFYALVDPIRKQGVANVITDNVVKSREGRGGWAIGSERKRSKAEVHLEMRGLEPLVRGGRGRSKIIVRKDRPGHLERPSPGLFVVEGGSEFSWRIDPDDSSDEQGGFRPTTLMHKVSHFLERRFDDPQSRTQIEEGVEGKTTYIRVAIDKLIEEGYASEFSGPRGARLVQFLKPFSEDEDQAA